MGARRISAMNLGMVFAVSTTILVLMFVGRGGGGGGGGGGNVERKERKDYPRKRTKLVLHA